MPLVAIEGMFFKCGIVLPALFSTSKTTLGLSIDQSLATEILIAGTIYRHGTGQHIKIDKEDE